MSCLLRGCKSRVSNKENEPGIISFHRFPKVTSPVRQKWLEFVYRSFRDCDWTPRKSHRLCSKHFSADSFVINNKRVFLKENAIPTKMFPPATVTTASTHSCDVDSVPLSHHVNEPKKFRPATVTNVSIRCHEVEAVPISNRVGELKVFPPATVTTVPAHSRHIKTVPLSHRVDETKMLPPLTMTTAPIHNCDVEEVLVSNIEMKHKIEKMQKNLTRLQNLATKRLLKINCLKQRTRRLKKSKGELSIKLIEFLHKEKIEKENIVVMDAVKNNPLVEKFLSSASGDKSKSFSPELKKFAVTLHFFSPRAYNFVREELNKALPHPKTISKWYQGIDCNPGFTKEALDAIKERVIQNGSKPLYVALSMDEMAIRKQVEWDGRNYFGYVNIGPSLDSDDIPLAKEALTFMVTAVNDSWKIAVGFFLLHSITAQQKATLVEQCLSLLKECGVTVVSLTYDGAATNKAMSSHLGCDDNPSKNCFNFDGQSVCLWPDPCHNIKLVRNAFADRKMLIDANGNLINWGLVERLNDLQMKEQIHLGNKLKGEHVNFSKQKMKVRLATQLLSQSVADALKFCEESNYDGFEDCKGTIKFIETFNNLFDTMNTRNFRAKGFKKPIMACNIQKIEEFFSESETYIKGLKFVDEDVYVLQSNRSTGFRGFVTCTKSLIQLYRTYVIGNSNLNFISTYKLSQDHLEMFFGAIRSKGGFNNNPSARCFQAAYKKLLVHAQFKDGANGNCIPLEKITLLNYSASSASRRESQTLPDFQKRLNDTTIRSRLIDIPEVDLSDIQSDHNYIMHQSSLTEYAHHVVHYIAGYVGRKLKKTLKCEDCLNALEEKNSVPRFSLIYVKDRGGLLKPSKDVTETCKITEKILREFETRVGMKAVGKPKHLLEMLNRISKKILPTNIFSGLWEHCLDNHFTDDHRHLLIKSIGQVYLKLRIHYMTKKMSEPNEKLRSFLNKTILFKGQ